MAHPLPREVAQLEARVGELEDRVSQIESRISAFDVEQRHVKGTLDEVRADVKDLRKMAERAVGGWIALGIVWTVLTFAVAMFMRR